MSFEGEVDAGQPFRRQFTTGLEFFLEPLASGWIVRVLAAPGGHEVREAHDYAGVATPPYRSPNPLLVSTDWAFRAQDAVAWNPRNFRYAATPEAFHELTAEMDRVHRDDRALAALVVRQPEASFRILDSRIVPGAQDQAAMASEVASSHVPAPVETLPGAASSPLGRIQHLHFRVRLELPVGMQPAAKIEIQQESCTLRPTE